MAMYSDSSDASGGLWGSTSLPARGRVVGVPKRCWCGERVVSLISKSDHNPYRRYFRCAYVVSEKIWGDDHAFKWVDEGLADEVHILKARNGQLEQELKVLNSDCVDVQMRLESEVMEKVQMKLESGIMERVEGFLTEAQCRMKKVMLQVVIGFIVLVVCIKLVV